MPNGYVIIKHQVFGEITDTEVLQQLPNTGSIPAYKIFDIKKEIVSMDNIERLDSFEYRIYQKNVIDNEIKPFLEAHPDYDVLYFGTATIPLALHLGYCFGSWKDVNVFLLHREHMSWNWSKDENVTPLLSSSEYVKEEFSGPIDVIYKVEATYTTQDDELKNVVENASKIISLSLDAFGKDVFKNQEQLKTFAHQFSLGLDSVAIIICHVQKRSIFFLPFLSDLHF